MINTYISRLCLVSSACLAGALLIVCRAHAAGLAPDPAAFSATLDAIVARERPDGGWTLEGEHGERAQPFTLVMQVAETIAAPLHLAPWDLLVVRSPGTPAAGLLLLAGERITGRPDYLASARRAGDLLLSAQLASGGWFSEMPVEGPHLSSWFRWIAVRTTLDDDVTPGAVRFLLALWQRTGDVRYRQAAERGLDLLLRAQLPSGAWPHVWRPEWLRAVRASREDHPSLNDGLTPVIVETLVDAAAILPRPELVAAARRGGDWLMAVQFPAPRAGWAQQYDEAGRPAAMRRFEPPALATWESRHAVDALDALARGTGDRHWCLAARAAARWLRDAAQSPGCWARFLTLEDGEPLYLDAGGARVAGIADARPGYDWQGDFGISEMLLRMGLSDRPVDEAPLAGDPGACPGAPNPLHAHHSARSLIAQAGMQLAVLEPAPRSPCAEAPIAVVAAGALR
jgi:PelA/Pel-15E family pectate lyase